MDERDWRRTAYELWRLLDAIDTLDDACREDDAAFRKAAYKRQQERWQVLNGAAVDRLYADFHPQVAA